MSQTQVIQCDCPSKKQNIVFFEDGNSVLLCDRLTEHLEKCEKLFGKAVKTIKIPQEGN